MYANRLRVSPPSAPVRLLLIEPAPAVAAPIRGLLEQNGVEVEVVSSAAEAREQDLSSFALMVVDVHLQEREGLLFVQWLQRSQAHLVGRVVVITADDHGELSRELSALDVCDIVPKPIDADEILRAVFECLEKNPADVH